MVWLPRGVVFGVWTALLTVFDVLSSVEAQFNNHEDLITAAFFACVLAGAVWAFADGYADPHRRQDLATQWALTTVVAAVLGDCLAWVIFTFNLHMRLGGPFDQIIWTALILTIVLYVPSTAAAFVGRAVARRRLRRTGEVASDVAQRQQIPLDAEPDDDPGGQRTQI